MILSSESKLNPNALVAAPCVPLALVSAATGWVGVMVLSPILGVLIYAVAGINRIRRATITAQRPLAGDPVSAKDERDIAAERAVIAKP